MNFFRAKIREAKTFFAVKKRGGGQNFFCRGEILKTRPEYQINSDRSLKVPCVFPLPLPSKFQTPSETVILHPAPLKDLCDFF